MRFKPGISRRNLAIFGLIFAFIGGGYLAYKSLAATSFYVAPSGSDSNSCSQSAPCATLNKAYQIASPGDTVIIKAGTYPGQSINPKGSMNNLSPGCDPYGAWGLPSTVNCIRFIPESGTVEFSGTINVSASGVWMDGERTGTKTLESTSGYNWIVRGRVAVEDSSSSYPNGISMDHNVFDGIYSKGYLASDGNHLMWRNNSMGGVIQSASAPSGGNCLEKDMDTGLVLSDYDESKIIQRRAANAPAYIMLDGNYFHDLDRDNAGANASCHFGGTIVASGSNLVWRNNVWSQNWVYALEIQTGNGEPAYLPPSSGVFENNWFGCDVEGTYLTGGSRTVCSGQDPIQFSGSANYSNWLIRYNSFGPSGSVGTYDTGVSYSNVRLVGNTGQSPDGICGKSGVSSNYNAWVGGSCGATDISVASYSGLFTDNRVGAEDYHLANATNPANNLVTPTSSDFSLSADIDGQTRIAPRDAGADEYGSSTTTPKPADLNNDGVVNITDLSILLSSWNTTNSTADINKDSTVNILDLSILLSNYGS
jgi:hypothetical protein